MAHDVKGRLGALGPSTEHTTHHTTLITPHHLTQLVTPHSLHTTHLTPLITHHSSHTTHLTQLITPLSSHPHPTHLTPLVSHNSSYTTWAARAFCVAGAAHRAFRGLDGRVGAAGPRVPFVWQAQRWTRGRRWAVHCTHHSSHTTHHSPSCPLTRRRLGSDTQLIGKSCGNQN